MMDTAKSKVWKTLIIILCGYVFGLVLKKSKIYDPGFIRTQLLFQSGFLLKLFLSAIATSQLCLCCLIMFPPTTIYTISNFQKFLKIFNERSILSSIIGGCILGVGVFLSGSFPGLEMVQIGAGIFSAVYTLFGMLVGLLIYEVIRPPVTYLLNQPHHCYKTPLLNDWLFTPYPILVIPIGATLGVAVCGIQVISPWVLEITDFYSEQKSVTSLDDVWPPHIAGAILGFLQIAVIISDIGLLCSQSHGSYSTVLSQLLFTSKIQKFCPSLNRHRKGFHNWLQVPFVIFIAIGSFLTSDTIIDSTAVPNLQKFIGGILLTVGTRLSGNCFMGHSITGISLLALPSIVTMTAFIGSTYITRFIISLNDNK